MSSKLYVRKEIERYKQQYNISHNNDLLLYIAILKGYYKSLGGDKYFAIPSLYDDITKKSEVCFRHRNRVHSLKSNKLITANLIRSIMNIGKNPSAFLSDSIPLSDSEIAILLAEMIVVDNTEDMIINKDNIYSKALNIMQQNYEREAGA